MLVTQGTDAIYNNSQLILLGAAALAFAISRIFYPCSWNMLKIGLYKSAKQILPAVPILLLIAMVSATWMLGGIVPSLIYYGIEFINPKTFLVVTCAVCSVISVLTGSSWTTCATIGIAFMGIGTIMGYNEAWIAGAVISGAYFGDKMSPLSDTTVLAASSTGVKLFDHIKYLFITTVPAMTIALLVYFLLGINIDSNIAEHNEELTIQLVKTFNISPWLLLAPVITCALIIMRINVLITLTISTILGIIGLCIFEPQLLSAMTNGGNSFMTIIKILMTNTSIETHNNVLNELVSTGGVEGMMNTIYLILSAMIFGGVMLGTGMLSCITRSCLKGVKRTTSAVTTTVGSGLFMNSCTGDQYLSIIITANLFKNLYKKLGLEPRLLGRSIEDSVSVTSVLIPWNSCGITQSTVLGVATLSYLPYCVFNYMCPIMSVVIAYIGYKISSYSGSNK
ncbi:MAG: sodium:proton antiporter [Muribaculaceae bacterium]|nr:sodium:proton antiporter [Muribaculaceae bacterium]